MIAAPRSLRYRLTAMYATIGFLILSTAGIALAFVAFEILSRPEALNVAQTAREIETMAARASASEATLDVQNRIILAEGNDGIKLIAISAEATREAPSRRAPEDFSLQATFGLDPHLVRVRDAGIFVIPNPDSVQRFLRGFAELSCGILVCSLVIAWLVARMVTRRSLAPLVTVTAELERFASGDFSSRTLAFNDATELGALAVAYNGAARQVTEAFLERQKVEEQIRQFVAEAGHELRTPLTVVAGYVDILRRGGDGDAEIRSVAFASLGAELKRMRALVERLMTLARLDSHREALREVVDIGAIIGQAVDALLVISAVPIRLAMQDDLFTFGDPGDVYEAISNLLENAIKYGQSSPISVRARADGAQISVRVADGGPGIPEGDRTRIFERFYRGSAGDQLTGSGLGLAIARKAAERLGGRLILEDARSGLTTFALHMPSISEHVAGPAIHLKRLNPMR